MQMTGSGCGWPGTTSGASDETREGEKGTGISRLLLLARCGVVVVVGVVLGRIELEGSSGDGDAMTNKMRLIHRRRAERLEA